MVSHGTMSCGTVVDTGLGAGCIACLTAHAGRDVLPVKE